MAWVAANPHFMKVQVFDPRDKVAEASLGVKGSPAGPESAPKDPTKTYTQNANVAPADVRGSLLPMVFGLSLPRS